MLHRIQLWFARRRGQDTPAKRYEPFTEEGPASHEDGVALAFREDLALVKAVQELVLEHGYLMKGVDINLTAPVYLENTKKTRGKFAMKLEIYRWGDDPFEGV
jgi:hypothetical protein